MTREEIKNIPGIVDYLLDTSATINTRTKLRKSLDEICNLAIKALEQPRWIPVSERLPETDIYDGHGPVWKNKVLITGYLSYDKEKPFVTTAFASDVIEKYVPDTNVTAWMPLPEPYKEESDGE